MPVPDDDKANPAISGMQRSDASELEISDTQRKGRRRRRRTSNSEN